MEQELIRRLLLAIDGCWHNSEYCDLCEECGETLDWLEENYPGSTAEYKRPLNFDKKLVENYGPYHFEDGYARKITIPKIGKFSVKDFL